MKNESFSNEIIRFYEEKGIEIEIIYDATRLQRVGSHNGHTVIGICGLLVIFPEGVPSKEDINDIFNLSIRQEVTFPISNIRDVSLDAKLVYSQDVQPSFHNLSGYGESWRNKKSRKNKKQRRA